MPAVFRAYPASVIRNSDYRQRTGNNALGMPPPPLHARCGSHEHSQQLIAALADMAQAGEPLPSLIYVNVTYPLALTLCQPQEAAPSPFGSQRDEEDHHASEAASFD